MRLPLYQVDAFADRLFAGNPAAICPLEAWLPEATMQAIAAENNLSETAFLLTGETPAIRWFTPTCEVDLCGHATLAGAWVWFRHYAPDAGRVRFDSRSGPLEVRREGEWLTLDFPRGTLEVVTAPAALAEGLGITPEAVLAGADWLVRLRDEAAVRAVRPDFAALRGLERRGVIVTAPGEECDFVSRFFAPNHGIDEDPVTGSAHCMLTPYWAGELGQEALRARQLSARGGELQCRLAGERVLIGGRVVPYLCGHIELPGGRADG